ncbi:hypothetical protein HHI36_001075 [Cryptolaemus montrouzieri]|uniref:Atos-like conserved domain-containing protein n=1 Tax=Cryptolaemus montrouzieri TaxID=559131 RepID=A0ABD2P6L3_9CUCU
MHNSSFNSDPIGAKSEAEVLLAVTTLVTEGRIPEKLGPKKKGFREGPHCYLNAQANEHVCDLTDSLCINYDFVREEVLKIWMQKIPLCIEFILTCECQEGDYFVGPENVENYILLESWNFNISSKRLFAAPAFNVPQLVNAIRSQLYFSQITAWLTTQDESSKNKLTKKHLRYRIALPGETFKTTKFIANSVEHNFPSTDIGCSRVLNVSFLSMPRVSSFPIVQCPTCKPMQETIFAVVNRNCERKAVGDDNLEEMNNKSIVDDRMHTFCTLKGKHHCEDYEELENANKSEKLAKFKRFRQNLRDDQPSTSTLNHLNNTRQTQVNQPRTELINTKTPNSSMECIHVSENSDDTCHFYNDLICQQEDKSKILLEAIERVGLRSPEKIRKKSQSEVLRNTNCKSKSSDMESQSDYPNKRTNTAVTDVECKTDLIYMNYIHPNDRHRTINSCHEDQRNCSSPNDKHKSIDSKIELGISVMKHENKKCGCDNVYCDRSKSDTCNRNKFSVYIDKKYCDSPIPIIKHTKMKDISNNLDAASNKKKIITRKLAFDDNQDAKQKAISNCDTADKKSPNLLNGVIPTAVEQAKFRKSLDNAASMVFHCRTGLPLTSSPAPVRKGKTCFDFDSSINSVSSIKSALYSSSFSTDEDSESDGSLVSPCSPDTFLLQHKVEGEEEPKSPVRIQRRGKGHASSLLGSFEESVLNGRLEPVSTVHGFTAELGASGSFVPKHLVVPVTVFFYTLCDNEKVSSPYLCHINLGKKGYSVPRRGTVQVTLFNPLGTVVKMFVIIYDLTDMPPNSQTFIRQRTLYMPNECKDKDIEWGPKWLKYLIHLRFVSSKSGKVYLHSDIRMIIFHKTDFDTATAHGMDLCYELRSFTLMPTNPRFSPRK